VDLLSFIRALFLVSVFFSGNVFAQMNKCVDAAGKVTFTDKACNKGERLLGTSGQQQTPLTDFRTELKTERDANIGHDCTEQWDIVAPTSWSRKEGRIEDMRDGERNLRKWCLRFGFRLPIGTETDRHNEDLARRLDQFLAARFPNTPNFTRTYEGGKRSPGLFPF
jgi:Domain of unknown function (DUF4124)